uniref:Uncharacterized protein n=1 Tax=Arundo donax TaxID=35708 RepID=A0A0A9G9P3_ARUDO
MPISVSHPTTASIGGAARGVRKSIQLRSLSLRSFLLLGLGLAPLPVGVGREAPEREHKRNALLAVELLVQEDHGRHFRHRDGYRDEDASQ